MLVGGDNIHIALNKHGQFLLPDGLRGQMQAVDDTTLVKEGSLR